MNKFNIAIVFSAVVLIYACTPYEEDGIDLPDGPSATFSWSYLENDSNRVVLTGLSSEDSFLHLWEFGNGLTSVLESDTAFYPQAGEYEVTYTVHNAGDVTIFSNGIYFTDSRTTL
jgi:PKD repeat protein